MSDNVEVFRQVIERGFNQGDLSVADEVCADDFAEHEYLAPSDLPGPEILKFQIRSAREEMQGLTSPSRTWSQTATKCGRARSPGGPTRARVKKSPSR